MKNSILAFIALCWFSSCTRDELVPCDKYGGIQGNMCREYRFVNGSSVGYLEFEHKGDTAIFTSFYNENNVLQQTSVKRFEDGRINAIATQFPDGPSLVQSWHYNELDSLSIIVFGANDSLIKVTYEEGQRVRETYSSDSVVSRYTRYQYFQADGVLFKVSDYNGKDSLLRYRILEDFSNGKKRINYFAGNNVNLGYRISDFSNSGLITSSEFRDATGIVTETATYLYNAKDNLTERAETTANSSSKSIFLYY
ncbi:MAG: hypothetical protein JKX84_08695 [Flavobacteriales bacterium]|nr:hypothetical protein [Flavobacteriales bacterium]